MCCCRSGWEADSGRLGRFKFSSCGSILLLTAGCFQHREPLDIIGSPSLHDEPQGYVAAEEQKKQICLVMLLKPFHYEYEFYEIAESQTKMVKKEDFRTSKHQ